MVKPMTYGLENKDTIEEPFRSKFINLDARWSVRPMNSLGTALWAIYDGVKFTGLYVNDYYVSDYYAFTSNFGTPVVDRARFDMIPKPILSKMLFLYIARKGVKVG